MSKLLFIVFLSALVFSFTKDNQADIKPPSSFVYICDSKNTTKYHLSKTCRGLSACKHSIIQVTYKIAVKKGKNNLCGWED